MSVSSASSSPSLTMRGPDSWNQGLVRGPDEKMRVSSHSPPRLTLPACSTDQISFSLLPAATASCISYIAASQAAIAQRIARISSSHLMTRAISVTACPSKTSSPSFSSARSPAISILSTASRRLAPAWVRIKSSICAANFAACSSVRVPDSK